MVFSETGAYLALIGHHGITVVELPQKRGKFTQFEHGKEIINCRFVIILCMRHEKECFFLFKMQSADERFRYDKMQ